MNYRRVLPSTLLAAVAFAAPTRGQVPTTLPALPPGLSDAMPSAADAVLGEVFTSRVEGIEFRPPAGGTAIRQLNSGEIVRFAYPDRGWTVRLKSAPNSTHLPMVTNTDLPDRPGLLDLTAAQLTDRGGVPAVILHKDLVPLGIRQVGLLEARDNSGLNRLFTQLALVPDGTRRYFILQMVSPGQEKAAPGSPEEAAGLAKEAEARQMFQRVLATVTLLDRRAFRAEQDQRLYNTRQLWVQLDQARLTATLQPAVRFMRVIRNGKDVGYVQVDQRAERHHGLDGFLVVARSHIEVSAQPAGPAAPAAVANPADAGSVVDLPRPTGAPGAGPAGAAGPVVTSQVDRDARFFVTWDRAHEDWTVITRVNNVPGNDTVELGNSDTELHRSVNTQAIRGPVDPGQPVQAGGQPQVMERSVDTLRVDTYHGKVKSGPTYEQQLDFRYLPQAMAQLLPQLLPVDAPQRFLFGGYVSEQGTVLLRYVDVGTEREADLDGRVVRAVPITDRIGADGAPTVHYVSREDGQWLGSVSDDGKLVVLPAEESSLRDRWKGFARLPEPAAPTADEESHAAHRRPAPRVDAPPADLPPTLDSGPFRNR